MNPSSTSTAAVGRPAAPASTPSPAAREVSLIAALVAGVILVGSAAQVFVAPGPVALVASGALAGAAVFVLGLAVPGKLRQTLTGFRFISVLLFALALCAVLGTLVLQGKPPDLYRVRYGAVGDLIMLLRLDDVFHSVWFGGLIALFGASVLSSAVQRWPPTLRNLGFFTCHAGLLTSLVGAALSTTLSVKGRVDLHAGGEHASAVRVTRGGAPTGELMPLGFDLRLDRFDVVRYHAEYRVGYYEPVGEGWRLKASFDPDREKHRLPGGDSFRFQAVYPDFVATPKAPVQGAAVAGVEYGTASQEMKNPGALLQVVEKGRSREILLLAHQGGAVRLAGGGVLTFERREDEVKSFRSEVTAAAGPKQRKATIAVNDPFPFQGWTFYQVNYDPKDPTYSGLEAVKDPGVPWVFLGFGLISLGVCYLFYVEPRLRRRKEA